jgi:hypothetical protein
MISGTLILPLNEIVVVFPGFSHKPDNFLDFERLLNDILACAD